MAQYLLIGSATTEYDLDAGLRGSRCHLRDVLAAARLDSYWQFGWLAVLSVPSHQAIAPQIAA